jgi:hypothetical protein
MLKANKAPADLGVTLARSPNEPDPQMMKTAAMIGGLSISRELNAPTTQWRTKSTTKGVRIWRLA